MIKRMRRLYYSVLFFLSLPALAGLPEATKLMAKRDWLAAERELKPLAAKGDTSAIYYLSAIRSEIDKAYMSQMGASRDTVDKAKKGNAQALQMLGMVYTANPARSGTGTISAGLAQTNLKRSAASGNPDAAWQLALNDAANKNWNAAVTRLTTACAKKHRRACNNLGVFLRFGFGSKNADPRNAFAALREGATLGNGFAMYNLALMHMAGHGVPKDNVQAYVWSKRAEEKLDGARRSMAATLAEKARKGFTPMQSDYIRLYGINDTDLPPPPASGRPAPITSAVRALPRPKPRNQVEQVGAGTMRFLPLSDPGPEMDSDHPARDVKPIPYADSPDVIADMIYRDRSPSLVRAALSHKTTKVVALTGDKIILLIPADLPERRSDVRWKLRIPAQAGFLRDTGEINIAPFSNDRSIGWLGFQMKVMGPGSAVVTLENPFLPLEERKARTYRVIVEAR